MMTTLTQKPLHFNRSIQLSSDGGALSSDTGELIFREFDEKLGFSQTIAEYLQLHGETSAQKSMKHRFLGANYNLATSSLLQFLKNSAPWKK